jgi:O-succinylbenzoic acid--CoA ligase
MIDELRALDLPISITYGSTETASQVSAFLPREWPSQSREVGRLLPIWEAKIDDGCLALRGTALCNGWWQNGHFWPLKLDAAGFFKSSDQGQWDGKVLKIGERVDVVFQLAGENLAPAEITRCLDGLKGLGEWIVIPQADDEYGHIPILIYRGEHPPPSRAIVEAALKSLSRFKWPRACYWHPSRDVQKPSRALYQDWLKTSQQLEMQWSL